MLENLLQRSPLLSGLNRSRWWLDGLRQRVSWLASLTLSGVSRLLKRLKLRYKRGRLWVHSPDLAYDLKMAYILAARWLAQQQPERYRFLYMDELTYYRRPSLTQGYAARGSRDPRAVSGYTRNRCRRIAASLEVLTGWLFSWQRPRFDTATLIDYFRALEAACPDVEWVFVALDNWSVHFHPDILLALLESKIVLLRLPTYAPWTNPVEKVWRRMYQERLHLHPFADDWVGLQQAVQAWLDQWSAGSADLLHYVGLLPD